MTPSFLQDLKTAIEKVFKEENVAPLLVGNILKYVNLQDPIGSLGEYTTKDSLATATKRLLIDVFHNILEEYQYQNNFVELLPSNPSSQQVLDIRNVSKKVDNMNNFRNNPYKHVPSAPLGVLDDFATKFNLQKSTRAKGTLIHILQRRFVNDGDTCYPKDQLIKEAIYQTSHQDLKGNKDEFSSILTDDEFELVELGDGQQYVYLKHVYNMELRIAEQVVALSKVKVNVRKDEVLAHISAYEQLSHPLSDEQRNSVVKIFTSTDILVITGYPGTGKSTTTNCIRYVHDRIYGDNIMFAAPTGIAATRLNDGKGMTLHRALQVLVNRKGKFVFTKNATNPFTNKLIIVDEFSMVDVELAYQLFDAIVPGNSKLVIIGDNNQLPSVGAGEVLKHIIDSGVVPVCKLTKIFRQGVSITNPIFEFAKSVNRGKMPSDLNNEHVKLISQGDSEEIYKIMLKLFLKHDQNCQILFPTKKDTTVGSIQGNRVIAACLQEGNSTSCFSKNDKIVCIKNKVVTNENGEIMSASSIFNGEIGRIDRVDAATKKVTFVSNSKSVSVKPDMIEHGWCVTVNKSQGSEYDNVVVILHPSQGPMLNRQVLYTAATRAKKKLYVISTKSTLQQAISALARKRHSVLMSIIASTP